MPDDTYPAPCVVGPAPSLDEVRDGLVNKLEWNVKVLGRLSPEGIAHDNMARAFRACRALAHYEDEDALEIKLSDLLGDMLHLCDAAGVEFSESLRRGQLHYEAELRGEI